MKYDNPIYDHWLKLPDLASFPDFLDESRSDQDIDLGPLEVAIVEGDFDRFMQLLGIKAKWTQRMKIHFGDVRGPHRKSVEYSHPVWEDLYMKGGHITTLDLGAIRERCVAITSKLLNEPNITPPPGMYDHIAAVPFVIPMLQPIFEDTGIMNSVSAYFNRRMSIQTIYLMVNKETDTNWQQFFQDGTTITKYINTHIDPKINVMKAIVYLNPVGLEQGPFSIVPGSHRFVINPVQDIVGRTIAVGNYCNTPELRASVYALPKQLRVSHNFGRCVADDSELAAHFDEHMVRVTSDMGNCIIGDVGQLIHQGGVVKSGHRVALQVIMK